MNTSEMGVGRLAAALVVVIAIAWAVNWWVPPQPGCDARLPDCGQVIRDRLP